MTLETWLAFFVAACLISVSPGAGAVACMTTGKFLRLLRAPRQIRFVNRLFGGLFVGAAALLAMFKRAA